MYSKKIFLRMTMNLTCQLAKVQMLGVYLRHLFLSSAE